MRHLKHDKKLGRTSAHRRALMASLVCNLIEAKRIKTTLVKAKEARRLAEKMVTLARGGGVAARRQVVAVLQQTSRVKVLFEDIAPRFAERPGGYTRIIKLGQRRSDGSEMALLEWVDIEVPDRTRKTRKGEENRT